MSKLEDMAHIKTDIQEEQIEITMPGCKVCGHEFDKTYRELHGNNGSGVCRACVDKKEIDRDNSYLTGNLISKLIYGEVGKADLKLYHSLLSNKEYAYYDQYKSFEFNQTEYALDNFRSTQSNVSRSLKKLIKAKLLIQNEETGKFTILLPKF